MKELVYRSLPLFLFHMTGLNGDSFIVEPTRPIESFCSISNFESSTKREIEKEKIKGNSSNKNIDFFARIYSNS